MVIAAKILTALIVAFFLMMWVQVQFSPEAAAEQLSVILGEQSAATMNTFRADIGGLFLGSGLLCLLGLLPGRQQFLLAAAVMMLAAIVGRLIGIVVDGSSEAAIGGTVVEVLFIVLLLFAHKQLDAPRA